jgi:hypothetical protein
MPNEKHFHGTAHINGGFDIDEATLPPNANYWRNGADSALSRLQKVVGCDEGLRQVENITGTWKEICLAIETLADLAERQARRLYRMAYEQTPAVFVAKEIYDATPCPAQPIIDMDEVKEIKF